ncbi:MAG: phage/plasmid primase, P4 family [Terriglobales bacterium]
MDNFANAVAAAGADARTLALALAAAGVPLVPIPSGQKACTLNKWPDATTTDAATIAAWFAHGPSNYGCVGKLDGFVILDCDVPGVPEMIAGDKGHALPDSFTVTSAGKRLPHIYFRHTERSRALGNRKSAGLFDWQAHNKYVVGPGSQLANGATYDVASNAPIADCPDWLVDWIAAQTMPEKPKGAANYPEVNEKFDIYDFLAHYGLSADEDGHWFITDVCPVAGRKHQQSTRTGFYYDGSVLGFKCFAGGCAGNEMTVGDVIKHLNKSTGSVVRLPYPGVIWKDAPQRTYKQTDGGNAERLVALHGENFRFLQDAKQWLHWDGRRWKRAADRAIHQAAKATVAAMYQSIASIEQEDERKRFAKWCAQADSRAGRENMVALARHEAEVAADDALFDTDALLLNVENGTVDLCTGHLRAHRREDLITKLCPVMFDPAAQCPRWLQFLTETFSDQPDVTPFLQRSLGYTLTGETNEQCFWLLIGAGRNGKSTMLNAVQHILGDYAAATSFDTFAAKRADAAINPRDGLAALAGSRLVRASESDEEKRFSEALLKAITGGEQVRTARMYQEDFAYKPTYKIWLSSNHEPTIRGTDDGIWRRVHRVNFRQQVAPEHVDRALDEKLAAEAPGILNWMLAGLADYRAGGLRVPQAVNEATAGYRQRQNPVREFLAERCDLSDPTSETPTAVLLAEFNQWARFRRQPHLNPSAFGRAMASAGYNSRRSNGQTLTAGVSINFNAHQGGPAVTFGATR